MCSQSNPMGTPVQDTVTMKTILRNIKIGETNKNTVVTNGIIQRPIASPESDDSPDNNFKIAVSEEQPEPVVLSVDLSPDQDPVFRCTSNGGIVCDIIIVGMLTIGGGSDVIAFGSAGCCR